MELPLICEEKLIVEDIFRFRSHASYYIQLWMDAFKNENTGLFYSNDRFRRNESTK